MFARLTTTKNVMQYLMSIIGFKFQSNQQYYLEYKMVELELFSN